MDPEYKISSNESGAVESYLRFLTEQNCEFMEDLRKYNLPEEKVIDLLEKLQDYYKLENEDKIQCQKTLALFFKMQPSCELCLEIIKQFQDPYIVMDFSRILLSSICTDQNILESYADVDFPDICLSLMSMFPEIPFQFLIKVMAKTLKEYDTKLLNRVNELIHQCKIPSYYGILIYRFVELSIGVQPEDQNKLIPICEYLLQNSHMGLSDQPSTDVADYKHILKIISLLFTIDNKHPSFYCGLKNCFIMLNDQLTQSDELDEEDIINILIIIQQYVSRIDVMPTLCGQINHDFISSLTESENETIKIKSLSILIQMLLHPSFHDPEEFALRIAQFKELESDLPFNLKIDILQIYQSLSKYFNSADINNILIDETFIDNIFDFLGCGIHDIVWSILQLCVQLVQISPEFAECLAANSYLLTDLLSQENDFSDVLTNLLSLLPLENEN